MNFVEEPRGMMLHVGDVAMLPCSVADPVHPVVRWFRYDEKLNPGNGRYHLHDDGVLEILSLQSSDFGNYKCQVEVEKKAVFSGVAHLALDENRGWSQFSQSWNYGLEFEYYFLKTFSLDSLMTFRHYSLRTFSRDSIMAFRHYSLKTFSHDSLMTFRHYSLKTFSRDSLMTFRHFSLKTFSHDSLMTFRHYSLKTFSHASN